MRRSRLTGGNGCSGIDVGVLGVCGFVAVCVLGVEDLFGEADQRLVAGYEPDIQVGDGALADVEAGAGDDLHKLHASRLCVPR